LHRFKTRRYYRPFKLKNKMKKLVAFAAVIAAVSFASCGNKSAESTESVAETEEATVVEEAPVVEEDAAATDSVAVEVTDSVAVEAAPAE
jgi:hypothetical protein